MGTFRTMGGYSASRNGVHLDPHITSIMEAAAAASPYNVVAFSGVAGRQARTGNHPSGHAVDIFLEDPATGQLLTNYSQPAYQHQGTWQENFPAYEQFAQTTRVVQQQIAPELDNSWRWGGYFNPGRGNVAPDLMHFDDTPAMGGAMGGGSWSGGATGRFTSTFGITTNGGLNANRTWARGVVEQINAPRPPGDVPNVAPAPMAPLDRQSQELGDAGFIDLTPQRVSDQFSVADEMAFDPLTTQDFGVTSATAWPVFDASYDPGTGLTYMNSNEGAQQQIATMRAQQQAAQQQTLYTVKAGAQPTQAGNIDLNHRPVVEHPDGSISTVLSATFTNDDGTAVLVPRVAPDGTILTNQQALQLYQTTGQNLGTFANNDAAETYAEALHTQQANYYANATPTAFAYGTSQQGPSIEARDEAAKLGAIVNGDHAAVAPALSVNDVVNGDFAAIAAQQPRVPVKPPINASGSPDERGGMGQWALDAIGAMQAIVASPPVPIVDPRSVPVDPMAADQRPESVAQQLKPADQTVNVNGHNYVVGNTYTMADGTAFRANANGTFTKTAKPAGNPTLVQLAIASQAPGAMDNAKAVAAGTASVAGKAATVVANGASALFGKLFGGGGTPKATVAVPLWSDSLHGGASIEQRDEAAQQLATRAAAIPTWQTLMNPTAKAPTADLSLGMPPSFAAMNSGTSQNNSSTASDWSKPYTDAIPRMPTMPGTNTASDQFAKAASYSALNADTLPKVPEYIKISKQVQVPTNLPIEKGSGVTWDATLGQYKLDDTPKPVQTYKTITQVHTIKNPAYVAQQASLSSGQQQQQQQAPGGFVSAATGEQLYPVVTQRYNPDTNRVDAVTVYRPAGGGQTAAQKAANQNSDAAKAIAQGKTSYVNSDSQMLMPTVDVNGNTRNSSGDSNNGMHYGSLTI